MVDEQLHHIAEKLVAVVATRAPLLRERFGSQPLRMRAPLGTSEVEAFEAEHGIALPGGYRRFITRIGDGGLGPHYGLCSLADWAEGPSEEWPLSTPFPAAHNASGPTKIPKEGWYPGAVTLSDQGGGIYAMLVVAGPAYGRIFTMSIDDTCEVCFTRDAGFLDWYERWLDSVLLGTHFETMWGAPDEVRP